MLGHVNISELRPQPETEPFLHLNVSFPTGEIHTRLSTLMDAQTHTIFTALEDIYMHRHIVCTHCETQEGY